MDLWEDSLISRDEICTLGIFGNIYAYLGHNHISVCAQFKHRGNCFGKNLFIGQVQQMTRKKIPRSLQLDRDERFLGKSRGTMYFPRPNKMVRQFQILFIYFVSFMFLVSVNHIPILWMEGVRYLTNFQACKISQTQTTQGKNCVYLTFSVQYSQYLVNF